MLIEKRLQELHSVAPETPKYLKDLVLEKAHLIHIKKENPRFSVRSLYIVVTSLLIIVVFGITIFSGINNYQTMATGYNSSLGLGGSGVITFPGYVGMTTKRKNKLNKPVHFKFNYGHDYSETYFTLPTSPKLVGHRLEILIRDKNKFIPKVGELEDSTYQLLYQETFSGDELLDKQYKIKNNTVMIWSKIYYNSGFELMIDFNDVVLNEGRIFIRLVEITIEENRDSFGNVSETEVILNRYVYLDFKKSDSFVTFSK